MKKRKDFALFQVAPTPAWVVKLVMCSACGEAYGALCIAFLFKMASSRTTYGSNLFFQTRLSFIHFMLLACVTGPPTLCIVENKRKGKGGWVKSLTAAQMFGYTSFVVQHVCFHDARFMKQVRPHSQISLHFNLYTVYAG